MSRGPRWPTRSEAAPFLVAFAGFAVVAVAGGALTRIGPWYRRLKTPAWKPPDWAFGPIWTTIFLAATVAAGVGWRRARTRRERTRLVAAFATNGVLNMGWSLLFFTLRRPDWALAEVGPLWLSVVAIGAALAPLSPAAAALMVPYLVWVSTAAALNAAIVRLNAPFD